MNVVTYQIPGINCHHCVNTIKSEIGELEGVQSVEGDPIDKKITIRYDVPATEDQLIRVLTEINFPPE